MAAPSSTSCLNIPRDSSYNLPDLPELSLTRCLKRFTQRIPTASTHFAPQDRSLPRLATITSFQEKDICIAMKATLFNAFFYCSPFNYQMNMSINSFLRTVWTELPRIAFPVKQQMQYRSRPCWIKQRTLRLSIARPWCEHVPISLYFFWYRPLIIY